MRAALLFAGVLLLPAHPEAAALSVDLGSTRLPARVASFRELRDQGVVRQQHDYSCGAAALATLLLHGFADPVSEGDLLARVFASASAAEERVLRNKGLSLLDMQRLAQERGYRAQGYRLAIDQLGRIGRPVIVFVQPNGYQHFAVLRGIRDGKAFLADPSQGNQVLPLHRFVDMWADAGGRGVIFAAEPPDGRWPPRSPLFLEGATGSARPPTSRELLDLHRADGPPTATPRPR